MAIFMPDWYRPHGRPPWVNACHGMVRQESKHSGVRHTAKRSVRIHLPRIFAYFLLPVVHSGLWICSVEPMRVNRLQNKSILMR